MFGQAKPAGATGFGGGGGGFGGGTGFGTQTAAPGTAPQATAGGFGFSTTNTSNNATTTGTSGWGAPAAATANTGGAWGAKPAAASWGTQPAASTNAWGTQPQPAMGGMGSGGWGQQQPMQPMQAQAPQRPVVTLQDFARQSALASFLMELDKAYDALGPKCRFRSFVYNTCPPGQMADIIQKERYVAFLNGGGVPEEDWMAALQASPDPVHTYPQPLHFAQELKQRCDKQKEELKRLSDLVDGYLQDVETVAALDEANKSRLRALRQEDVMLLRRWFLLQQKLEVLSRWGQRSGEESLLLRQVKVLQQTLAAPGRFRDALAGLQPLLDGEAELCAEQQSAARRSTGGKASVERDAAGAAADGLLRSHVDAQVMEGWVDFAKQMQDGIHSLHDLLDRDLKDMVAIRERVAQ